MMKLAVDIGNTDVVVGVNDGHKWIENWRMPSNRETTELEYETRLRTLFLESGIVSTDVTNTVISSVVPSLTDKIVSVLSSVTLKKPLVITADVISSLALGPVVNPHQIGSDLVANAAAAYDRFGQNAIVVDFGTALTFTSVDAGGAILGVAISPGVRTAMKSLSANTAKLPEIPLEIPEKVLGSNTVEAMQSGIMQGYVGLVRHMVTETARCHAHPPKVIATGGLSFVFEPLHDVFDALDRDLTLHGILLIGEKVQIAK